MNVLIINGHPDRESLETSAAIAYQQAAVHTADKVEEITISELKRASGSRNLDDNELAEVRKKIETANHLVWIYPSWNSGLPKGTAVFIQLLFGREKIYEGKSARIITTMEENGWKYRWFNGKRHIRQFKREVLQRAGIYSVEVMNLGYVKEANKEEQSELLRRVARLGRELG